MKKLMFALMALLVSTTSWAQHDREPNPEMIKKIEKERLDYLNANLGLSKQDSITFNKLYDQFSADQAALRADMKAQKKAIMDGKKKDELSDDQWVKLINLKFDYKQKRLDLERDYSNKVLSQLGAGVLVKIERLEFQFKKQKLDKHRGHRKGPKHE